MTFLSTGLLAGLIATGIPIALHLLARQQPKRIVFPATRFLKQTLDTHRDRLKIRRWWLLAMRMCALALFALALARPQIHTVTSDAWFLIGTIALTGIALLSLATVAVVRGMSKPLRYGLAISGLIAILASAICGGVTMARAPSATLTDASPAALAIVIDNSIRTSRRLAIEGVNADKPMITESALDRGSVIGVMRESATWMVKEQTSGSLIAVIDRSPRPATFSVDHAAAINRIERTQPLAQTLPLPDRVQAAVSLVRSSELERKSVLLITDLTSPSFDAELWKSAELESLLKQEPPIVLQILDVGSESLSNYSLNQLKISDPTPPRLAKTSVSVVVNAPKPITGQPPKSINVQLDFYDTATAANTGLPIIRDGNVVLPSLRGVDRTTIETTNVSTRAVLSIPPLEAGTHHGVIRLVTEDELEADNARYFTLVVQEPRRVLLVGADRVDFNVLADALTAPLANDDPLAEYIVEWSEFLPSGIDAWNRFAAVILIDPQSPAPPARAELDAYLRTGGHVLSLLGPSLTRPDNVAESFPQGLGLAWRIPEPGTFFEILRPNHPAVASLHDVAGGVPWNAFPVSQYWQLSAGEFDVVIAEYANTDHPALIERTAPNGQSGTHLIVTTPMPALGKRGWNKLFSGADIWPAWLLIRDMVESLVYRDRGNHNLMIGQSTRIPIASHSGDEKIDAARTTRVQLFSPTGPPTPLAVDNHSVTLAQLNSPGTYWLKATGETTGVSVNLNAAETDLSRIESARLNDWLGKDGYTLVRTRDEIRQAEGRGQPTRSLYSTILLLMLAAFVLEQILSNRFYASRAESKRTAVAA